MNQICTIYADASVCPHTKASAWGAWVKHDGLSFQYAAPFKENKESTTTAEMAAMACGLIKAKGIVRNLDGTLFVIVSDCQAAIDKLAGNARCKTQEERTIEEYVRLDRAEHGYRIKINKVKGHSKGDGVRSIVNDIAHKLAITEMRKLRAQLS